MSLETRNFVAKPADIKQLARDATNGDNLVKRAKGYFFKCLVANSQVECGGKPRLRAAPDKRLSKKERRVQLRAVRKVYKGFLAELLEAIGPVELDPERPELSKAEVLRSKTNFARSAKSTIVRYIDEGHDLLALCAAKVTKNALVIERKKVKRGPPEARAITLAASLAQEATRLAESDKAAARRILEGAMSQLATALADSGIRITAKPADLTKDNPRPVDIEGTKYFPAVPPRMQPDTAVANQRAA